MSTESASDVRAGRDSPRVSAQPERLLTVSDVAAMLKVPVSWVYEHTRPEYQNPLPCLKLGKYLRFSASDIADYLAGIRSGDRRKRP